MSLLTSAQSQLCHFSHYQLFGKLGNSEPSTLSHLVHIGAEKFGGLLSARWAKKALLKSGPPTYRHAPPNLPFRDGLPKKRMFAFEHCPNQGGGALPEFSCPFFTKVMGPKISQLLLKNHNSSMFLGNFYHNISSKLSPSPS